LYLNLSAASLSEMRINEDRSLLAFVFSLALHGSLAWLVLSQVKTADLSTSDTVQVDFLEKESKYILPTQISQKPEEEPEEKLKKEAKFLADLTRRVKDQMRAKQGTKTTNGGQPNKPSPNFNFDPASNTSLKVPSTLRNTAIGQAEFAERVPGIKQGYFNSLNSDQLTYYTFYSRINEQISYRWVSLVKNYLFNLPPDQLQRISNSNKRTVIEVLLDAQGNYFSSLIHNASGIQALDEATFKAFRLATPFVNPPQGLVDPEDGLIHLYYEFNVIFDPLPMAGPNQF